MSNPFDGMPGLDETSKSAGADPFAGMPGGSTKASDSFAGMPGADVSQDPDDPNVRFNAMLADPVKRGGLEKVAASQGTTIDNPDFQARMKEPLGFRAYTTLSQLAATGDRDEAGELDARGKPKGVSLMAALVQFGHAGGLLRRRKDATISRIGAGQEIEVGDYTLTPEQRSKLPAMTEQEKVQAQQLHFRQHKKVEDMSRIEQDASVPKEILDIVNQNENPEQPLDPRARGAMIAEVAKAGEMSRARTKAAAAEELALREQISGKSDGPGNTLATLAAKGMPTVGYGNTFVVGGAPLAALVSGIGKQSELLTANINPETGEVSKEGESYGKATLKGFGYGAFEAASEVYTGKVLGKVLGGIDQATGGYVRKALFKGLDKAAVTFGKTALGRGVAEFAKGVQRISGLSALDNPATEWLEETEQQWTERAFAQRASDTTAPIFVKNVLNESTGQIEQIPVEPGSEEEQTAKRQIAHYGDKSAYSQVGTRQMKVGEKTEEWAKDYFTWANTAAMAEGFALQYALTLGGGAIHAVQSKEARGMMDRALMATGEVNASDLIRMSDEQKAQAFEGYYGDKAKQAEFAEVFKDAGEKLSDMAQRVQDAKTWAETGNSLKPNFETDLAKAFAPDASGATGPVIDETSNITVSQTAQPEGMAITVHDNDGVLNDVTVNSVQEAQTAAERMSQMKQGRQADMNKRAEIATRLAQTFAPGRKLVLVNTDADMRHATRAEYEAEGATFTEADAKAGAKGATTPGGTIILNVAAATGVNDLVSTIGHETGHSVFTQSGMAALMKGKGLKDLADELQRAKIIPPDIKSRSAFLSAVMEVKAKYELQGVKLNDAGAAEEVLANMNEGADPVIRKRFADNFVNLYRKMRGTDQNPAQTLEDARRAAAVILHSRAPARVEKGGAKGAWEMPAKAFEGDPIGEASQKASVEPAGEAAAPTPVVTPPTVPEAQGEAPAPVVPPVEAPVPVVEPAAEASAPAPEAAPAPKEPKVFKSVEEFAQFFSEHPEAQAWEDGRDFVIQSEEKGDQDAVQKSGAEGMDAQEQARDGEGVGKGDAEGAETAGPRQEPEQPAGGEDQKPQMILDGGTPADIEADKAKLAAQEQKRKEREEIEAKAKAPIEGGMGEMTGALPGMEATDDIPLFDQQKPAEPKVEKPTEAPKEEIKVMGVAVPPPEPSKPAEISDYAEKNARVAFASDVERGQYAEVPGVSTKAGKRVYLDRSAGSRRDYELADQHEGIVKNGMAVLLRTKGESGRINAVRIVGGGAMPEGSKEWGVDQWVAHNQKLAKGKEAPKAPEAPKPAEPKVEEQKPPTEAPKPTFSKMRFPSEAAMEAWVLGQKPEELAALPEDWFEITGEQTPEAPAPQPEAKAPEASKPEFTFRKMRLGEPAFKYNREKEAARAAWEAEQASAEKGTPSSEKERQVPSEETSAKTSEESEEARQNIETRNRMRAIPDVEYKAAPALAAIDAEIPAYEARKAAKVRTADSKERQAYSTPPPLAAIGAEAAKNAVTIVEPTAGNGGLLAPLRLDLHPSVSASQMKNRNTIIPAHNALTEVLANELDPERAARLQEFLGHPVTQGDYAAEAYQKSIAEAAKKGKRAFLMNPPFGPSDESGYKLEHRIALETTKSAVPGDSLFFIGAAPSRDAMTVPAGGLAGRYTLGEFAKFHEELNRQGWAPKLHFIADGALYRKMGAAFPVEVLLMEKTSKPGQHRPMRDLPGRYSTWEDIRAAVAQMYDPAAPKRITDQINPKTGELDLDAGNARFRLTDPFNAEQEQKILTGQIEPVTNKPVPVHFLKIFGKMWLKEFDERAHNPSQLAAAILDLPTETAHARIGVADAIADFLRNSPEASFQVTPGYVSMSLALRDEFHNRFQAPVAAAEEREADLDKAQIPYEPYSDVNVVSPMMIPRDLTLAMHTAMNAFLDRHPEGVDAFVAERMKWTLKQATDGRLDGSQMDTLALALDKVDEGSGFIVGSQTGAGKGRVMAAVMAHHIKHGRTPVFFTAKANLFTAMWEDITAIGEADLFKPLVYNNYQAPKVDSEDPDAEDADGFRMPMFFSDAERKAAFHNGKLPKGATAIFTTYSQIQNQDESAARKTHLIGSTLQADGGLVMDEAHLAAGEDSNTGAVLRRLADIPASGVVFSSATFAKRGENMTLYKRAGYSRFFRDDDEMSEALKYGKLPFQQYLAARLTEGGYYIRHELDYTDIVFDQLETTDTVPLGPERTALANREVEVADTFNVAIRTIMRFAAMVKAVNAGLQKGFPTAQINSAAFMSSLHNIASFIYTSLKAETVANAAVEELRAGRAPVITLYNTNQALLEQIGEGNEADVGRYLAIIAEKAIAITLPDGSKVSILSGEGASHLISIVKEQDAARIIEQARGVVRQAQMSADYLRDKNLPASPIDRVREIVEASGYNFGELTGRSLMVKNGVVTTRVRPDPNKVIDLFNNSVTAEGKPNTVILLNSSGSTGLSIHNSPKFKNIAKRVMFVLQPMWDINEMMQTFGRVNRKDQTTKPAYRLMFTSAAGEQRNAAILMQKLRSLSANTSGVSKAGYGESVDDNLDFMNVLGDKALVELTKEKFALISTINMLSGGAREIKEIRRATAISQFLPVAEQAEFIAQVQGRVVAMHEDARESGMHDLEAGDIGRVPLTPDQIATGAEMRAYEVPITGKAKILMGAEAIAMAKAWQAENENLLVDAKRKIDVAVGRTQNAYLHAIYARTAQTLEHVVDSIGRVWYVQNTDGSGRTYFIPVGLKLAQNGAAHTAHEWRVRVSFNNIRGLTTIPMTIFTKTLLDPAGEAFSHNYNASLSRKDDRTLIAGDIAKALIGNIINAWQANGGIGMPRIVRAYPKYSDFASFVLMMPRGISVPTAQRIVSSRLVPVTDVQDIIPPKSGGWLDIDAGRVRIAPTYNSYSGEMNGTEIGFRIATPRGAKSGDISVAAIMRAAGFSNQVNTPPDSKGYVTVSAGIEQSNTALANLAKLSPYLQAKQVVTDGAQVKTRFLLRAEGEQTGPRGMGTAELRRYLISSLGYTAEQVDGLTPTELVRLATKPDDYFTPFGRQGGNARFKLSDPIQVGTPKSQEKLEEESDIPFPVLNAMRGASKLVIPYIYKGGAYDWFRERGGLSSFTLAERLAFFKRPSNPENAGNIDALAQELGFSDTEEFANAFLNEIQRSRELYNAQKAMMDARRGALATAAETFPGRSSQDISRVMGQAVDTLSYILPPDIRADIERIGDMEGEEAVRNYILTGHFEAVLMEMSEQFSYEGRDDTAPGEIQDEGTYARPEVIDKGGNTAETLQQTKARIAVIAATLGAQQPQGAQKLTDEAAAAQIREMIEREGVDVAMGAARNLVAQRLAGQRDTPLNKAEAALMLRYQVQLDARLQNADREVKWFFDAGDLANLSLAETERQNLTTETMEYLEAMRKYGSLAGQALQALQMRVDRSFNIVKMYHEAKEDNGGLPLTPEQYAKLRARVAKLEQAWADYVDAASMPDEETDLNQRVKDLEADIGKLTGEIASRQGETAEAEQKLIALRIEHSKLVEQADVLAERRAGLQGEVDRLETEIAFRKALAQEVEILQAKVDKLNAQLLSLDAEYAGVDSKQLRELEKRLTELTAEYNAKRTAYEKAAEDLKTANQRLKRVLEMIKRLEKGTKAKVERRRAVKQQAANLYGVFKAEMEAAQLERMANQWRGAKPMGKLWMGVTVLQNIVRATQSSGDESVAGRQLAKLGISHPLQWLRAFRDSQRLMFTLPGMTDEAGRILSLSERSDRVLFEIDQMMRENPLWQTLRKAGLDWIDLTADPSSIDEQQLPVAALLRRALPSWTGREAVATVLTISNNHYAGMSNMLRFAVAAQMYEQLQKANGGAVPTEADLRDLVSTVDIFGGRGDLTGSTGRAFLRFTSKILYSPRLAAANVQFATRAVGLLGNPSYSLKARKMIASEYLRVFAGYGVLTAVAYLLSKMFSDDPDKQRFQREWGHPAFLQFMIGQNRIDPTGGFAIWARYPGSIFGASDRVSTESGLKAKGERQPFDANAFVRLLRSKLTPFAGFLTDIAIGKTYGGEAAGPRARPNMPGYDKRYLNMWQSLNPVSLSLQSLVGLMQGDKEQGVQPLRNPLLVTTAMGAEMLGILASSVPVNSALAQQVEAGYTKRAEKLETLKRQQKALMSDKKLSPVIKQVRSQRLQRQIDILRGNAP